MTNKLQSDAIASPSSAVAAITDKKGYGAHWKFSTRHIDNLIASGLPHLKIGQRRVRIIVEEADAWMRERFSTQRRKSSAVIASSRKDNGLTYSTAAVGESLSTKEKMSPHGDLT